MKKRSALIFGLLAVVLAFSMVLAGCDDPNNDPEPFSLTFTGTGSDAVFTSVLVFAAADAPSSLSGLAAVTSNAKGVGVKAANAAIVWTKEPPAGTYVIIVTTASGAKKKTGVELSGGANSVDFTTFSAFS